MPRRTSGQVDKEHLSFSAFLSHRYKSPAVNLYFFKLFSEIAEVQFEVDEGTFVMNVTRVERMIRDSDAFIGIYPFPGTWDEAQTRGNLQKASQYFRLELDLAIRSRKPAIIFYDNLYGNLLKCPDSVMARDFDAREVTSPGGSPKADLYREAFKNFCTIVEKGMSYGVARARSPRKIVGIGLPDKTYRKYQTDIQRTIAENWDGDLGTIPWPPRLDGSSFTLLQDLDWAIVDLGKEMVETGIPAYLHGRFVPMMRLKYSPRTRKKASLSPLEKTLFGGVEVGYAEDVLPWSDKRALVNGIKQRLRAIKAKATLISTAAEATEYFQTAARRKEAVFFSYAGTDRAEGARLSAALKEQFQKVFDYRDGQSIRAGEPWIDEIFDQLSASAVGISLLSEGYVKSENCMHEARDLVAMRDDKSIKFVPIYLAGEKFKMPALLRSTQYLEWKKGRSPEDVVKQIVERIK